MLAEPFVELQRQAADRPLEHVLGFRRVDAAGAEAADMPRGLDEHNAVPSRAAAIDVAMPQGTPPYTTTS